MSRVVDVVVRGRSDAARRTIWLAALKRDQARRGHVSAPETLEHPGALELGAQREENQALKAELAIAYGQRRRA